MATNIPSRPDGRLRLHGGRPGPARAAQRFACVALLAATACTSRPAESRSPDGASAGARAARFDAAVAGWLVAYRQAWGADPDPSALDSFRRSFDCLWDGLARRGIDPVPDIGCRIRSQDVFTECMRSGIPDDGWTEYVQSHLGCTFSPDYAIVSEACSPHASP